MKKRQAIPVLKNTHRRLYNQKKNEIYYSAICLKTSLSIKDISVRTPMNSRCYYASARKSLAHHQLALRSFCNSPLWTAALRSELRNSIKVTRLRE